MTTTKLISDNQSLTAAHIANCLGELSPLPFYDDGYGPLFIHFNALGIYGIIRARNESDAYEISEDEFMDEASETWEEMEKDYSTEYKSGRELWMHENGNDWEAWKALSGDEKNAIYRKGGKDVPFEGEISEHPCWQEAFGFRPNGPNQTDKLKHGIYAKDMNCDLLCLLTPEIMERHSIKLSIETEQD